MSILFSCRSSCLPPPRMLGSSALVVFTTIIAILSLTVRTTMVLLQRTQRKTSTMAPTLLQRTLTTYRSLTAHIAAPLWALPLRRSIITTAAARFRKTRTLHRNLTALASTAFPVPAARTVRPAAAAASSPVEATSLCQRNGSTDMASPLAMGRCVTMTTVWFQHLLRR